jgi:lon-related putative ATP-dependent protease
MTVKPLKAKDLYKSCDINNFNFNTTADLTESISPLGQERAISAVEFCMNMPHKRFNMYCLGPEGTGKTSLVRNILAKEAKNRPAPDDWCYVNNFSDNYRPRAIRLPAGMAKDFAKDIEALVNELQETLPSVFENETYQTKLKQIDDVYKDQKDAYFNDLQKKASGKRVSILRMPVGLVVAPMKEGEILTPEAFDSLPENEQKELLDDLNEMQAELEVAVKNVPEWEKEQKRETQKLKEDLTDFAISHLINDLKKKYKNVKEAVNFLKEVYKNILENVNEFVEPSEVSQSARADLSVVVKKSMGGADSQDLFTKSLVNPIICNDPNAGAPVVFLDHPTLAHLVGKVERRQSFGALISDFNLIKPGALHQANGGFLVIDAHKLVMQPNSWESLKRAIRSSLIKIEQNSEDTGFSTVSLEPEPIPFKGKIILIGETGLYYNMSNFDPDFDDLFKIAADFCLRMDRNAETEAEYANLIGSLSKRKNLRSLNKQAVGRVIEYASRIAGDSEKLSAHITSISDLIREADYWARMGNSKIVGKNHIEQAINAKDYRTNRIRESVLEEIEREIILIDTCGELVGQINSLVVFELGPIIFGKPAKITCQARVGKGEVVDIEREVDLSGPIHSKGVFILKSFLANRFAKESPLSLSATLVFEQSYGGVDGDSASSTELYVLLSAIAEVPIKQNFAVTGSVNQFGQVQAIGGVNEKIEGFFEICKKRGLDGSHGVLIPEANVKDLMLKEDVVKACQNGLFKVYPISHVDEGIEILTGFPAGVRGKNGDFPKNSINYKVDQKLKHYTQKMREFSMKSKNN